MKKLVAKFIAAYQFIFSFLILILLFSQFASAQPQRKPVKQDEGRGMSLETVRQLPVSSKRYALVIGVDKYSDPQVSELKGAVNDANSLARALVSYAGFSAEQVTLLASNQPDVRQPTRGNILRWLSNISSAVPPDGLLLVAFAGHGIERGGQAFLLPSDAQVSNDIDLLEATAINVTHFNKQIKKANIGQVLLLLDACRNDPVAGRGDADNKLTNAYARGFNFDVKNHDVKAFATIYATEVGHRAYEYREKQQGYFTWALIEGLKGGAANERGEVTLAGLLKYLQERVPQRVRLDLGAGKEQKPFAVVEGYRAEELIISAPGARAKNNPVEDKPVDIAEPSSGGAEVSVRSPVADELTGTSWDGVNLTDGGQFVVEFLADGKLKYLVNGIQNGEKHQFVTNGTWKRSGKTLLLTIGSYSTLTATLDGISIKGEGGNTEGGQLKWTLIKK